MALASNTVIGMKGGTAVVKDGKVAASLAYPVAGMLSLDGPDEVGRAHKRIVEIAGEICAWQPPYRTFKALSGQSLRLQSRPASDRSWADRWDDKRYSSDPDPGAVNRLGRHAPWNSSRSVDAG